MSMSIDDYRDQVKSDLLEFAKECYDYDNDVTADYIMDQAWIADSVTGNGSGSYTFNTWQAQQNISDLIWDDDLLDMFKEYGYDRIPLEQGPEPIDVSIRCFLLGEFASDVEEYINELNSEKEEEKETADNQNV